MSTTTSGSYGFDAETLGTYLSGHSCYRPRRRGERKRKSVRGCIVGPDLSVISLVIVKKGDADIPGLTDTVKPRRLGPKRATRIRKLFNLGKDDDVRQYVVRRQIVRDDKKGYSKAPKIQRLITPNRVQRKRRERAIKRQRYFCALACSFVVLVIATRVRCASMRAALGE